MKELRISATQLEKWRKFREFENYSEEDLCNDLFGEFIPSQKMEIGTAFHSIMEEIKSDTPLTVRYAEFPADDFYGPITERNTWVFDYVSVLQINEYIKSDALKEKKSIKWIEAGEYRIQLVAKPDAIHGLTAYDYKTRWRPFAQADDVFLYYIDSIQWKVYLMVYSLLHFTYVIVNLTKTEQHDIISIEAITPISLHAYAGMYGEVTELLHDFAKWITLRNYEHLFPIKEEEIYI